MNLPKTSVPVIMTSKTVRGLRRQAPDVVSKALCFSATREEDADDRSSVTDRCSDTNNNSELEDIQESSITEQLSFCSDASTIYHQTSWIGPSRTSLSSASAITAFGRPSSMYVHTPISPVLALYISPSALRACQMHQSFTPCITVHKWRPKKKYT
jgi:hypothetical protein